MSARSIYLRDQAANCEWHAKNIRDDETEVALKEMAARYVAEAEDIESRELATRQMKEAANLGALLARVTSPRIYGCNSRQPQFVNIPSSCRP